MEVTGFVVQRPEQRSRRGGFPERNNMCHRVVVNNDLMDDAKYTDQASTIPERTVLFPPTVESAYLTMKNTLRS